MKRIYLSILGLLVLAACGSKEEGFTLEATVTGDLENGTQIFLKTTDSLNQLMEVDTAIVENGTFSFKGFQDEPKMHYLFIGAGRSSVPFILENGDIEIKFQKDSLNYAKLKGTVQNDFFMDFLKESRSLSERATSMQNDMRIAASKQDTATVAALREEYIEFQEEVTDFNVTYVKEHPDAFISVLILGSIMTAQMASPEELEEMYQNLTPEMKLTAPAKVIKERLDSMKSTEIGSIAPEFSAPTPNGNILALSDVKKTSKLTLVDFWAAWCRPCRAENPNIVSVYHKYHDKGFNVVGVSLDTKAEHWKKAIADDGLEWNHISNLKRFRDPIAQLYNINAIPAAFLIDENGVIVAKNLRGPALEEKVAELLN